MLLALPIWLENTHRRFASADQPEAMEVVAVGVVVVVVVVVPLLFTPMTTDAVADA